MNQQPDTFFREKLQDYQKSMPTGAWDRIEMNLDKKNNKGLWLKVAASLTILFLSGYLLWLGSPYEIAVSTTNSISTNQTTKIVQQKKNEQIARNTTVTTNINNVKPKSIIKNKLKLRAVAPLKFESLNQITTEKTEVPTETLELLSTSEKPDESLLVKNESLIDTLPSNSLNNQSLAGHVTLVYTVEEVREKFLDKNEGDEATLAGEKTSTLKKLLNKVYDLKNNQDPFGELRQKKDEILAFNFKKRTEN